MYCYNCMSKMKEGGKFCPRCGHSLSEVTAPHHLKPGTVLNNKYYVGNAIGEGGFGITYIGRDLTLDLKIAVKEFYPSGYANRNHTFSNRVTVNYSNEGEYLKSGTEHFLREAKNIAKFSQERGVVNVRDFFSENDTAYIIMEYLEGENLSTIVKNRGAFDPRQIFTLFLPMMQTLEKMHREMIIHRDISPENVRMLPDGTLKLMDFGSARYFAGMEKKTMSVQFKQGYAPFEQYSKNGNQGPWTDVYGLCATLYKCITRKTPVDSLERCQTDTLKKPSELGVEIPPALEKVLMYGLTIYPENRCQSMEELYRITQAALNDEAVVLQHAENNSTAGKIGQTKVADEQYKTMFADMSQKEPPHKKEQPEPPKKKSRSLLIAALIALTVLLVAGIGVLTFFAVTRDKDDSEQSSTTQAAETAAPEENTTAPAATAAPTTQPPTTEGPSIIVPDVTGKKLSDAQKQLENMRLKVETATEFSASVQKGYIVRQSIAPGEKLKKGNTVLLYVSKSSGVNNQPYNQKVVVTAADGSSYADLVLYNWEYGDWVKVFSCEATVGKGGISAQNSESNTLTPKGAFPLGVVLTVNRQNTSMSQYTVTRNTVICDDSRDAYSNYYNQIFEIQNLPSGCSSDHVGEKLMSGSNNALIFIQHNGTGFSSVGVTPGNSSVITICGCYNSIQPTYGCIDIGASDMTQLLGLLDSSKNPYIITEVK